MMNFEEIKTEIFRISNEKIKRKRVKRCVISSLCALLIISVSIGAKYAVEHRNTNPIYQKILKFPKSNHKNFEQEYEVENYLAYIKPWDKQSVSEQFSEVEIGDVMYNCRGVKISTDMLLDNMGNYTAHGFDEINQIRYTKSTSVYSVKDISSDCVVAVKFDDVEEYYVYINAHYTPDTLGELIEKVNLSKLLSFEDVSLNYSEIFEDTYINETVVFSNVSDEVIWQKLLSDTELKNVHSDENFYGKTIISIGVNIELLGYENIGLWISEDGYMQTNILDTGKAFYIGEKKLEEFRNYLLDNCDGKRYSYTEGMNDEDDTGEYEETASHEVTVEE